MQGGDSNSLSRPEGLKQKPGTSPIFICGMARSGTTLLSALLDAHPQLAVFPGETYFYRAVVERRGRSIAFQVVEFTLSHTLMRWLARTWWQALISVDRDTFRNQLLSWSESFPSVSKALREERVKRVMAGCHDTRSYWNCFLELYDLLTDAPHFNKRYWVEKTPSNERFVTLIEAQFGTSAQYLHIIRDPRDVVASWLLRAPPGPAHRSRYILRICNIWALSVLLAVVNTAQRPNRYQLLRYEDLVRNTEGTMTGIAESLCLPMNSGLLLPTRHGDMQDINTAHSMDVPSGTITTDLIGRHRKVLRDTEIYVIEQLLGPQMAACGYALQHSHRSGRKSRDDAVAGNSRPGLIDSLRRLHVRAIQRRARPLPLRSDDKDAGRGATWRKQ